MKVVLTTLHSPWSPYSGGGQRSTHNLACALATRGHEVVVVYSKPPHARVRVPADLPYRVRWAALLDLRDRRRAPLRPAVALSVLLIARDELRRSDGPCILHANGEEGAALPWLRKSGEVAVVVTPRYPSLPSAVSPDASVTQRLRLVLLQTKFVTLGAALRGADVCSPPSDWAGEMMAHAYGLDEERVIPVHNGVPAEFLEYRWEPNPGGPIVFFGRLADDKGALDLVEAIARLRARGLDLPPVELFGRGPEEATIEARIRLRGLDGRVSLLGWADHHRLGRSLSQASMAVLPSHAENFSLAVLGVLAVGTPLVTTRVGGTPEVIDDGIHALLCPAGEPASIAERIREVLEDPEAAALRARRASTRVRSEFTWDRAASRFERVYEAALRGGENALSSVRSGGGLAS